MLKRLILLLVILILMTVSLMVGYYFGIKSDANRTKSIPKANTNPIAQAGPKSIITAQFAVGAGEVVKVDQSSLTLKGADNQQISYRYSDKVRITRSSNGQISATSSPPPLLDVSQIHVGDRVNFSLELKNNEYQIRALTLPPLSTAAATPNPTK